MFTAKLFLGLEITPVLEEALETADPQAIQAFVQNNETYLHDLFYENKRYLGKIAGEHTDISTIEQLEANIRSLLVKIFPQEILLNAQLFLFPIVESDRHDAK